MSRLVPGSTDTLCASVRYWRWKGTPANARHWPVHIYLTCRHLHLGRLCRCHLVDFVCLMTSVTVKLASWFMHAGYAAGGCRLLQQYTDGASYCVIARYLYDFQKMISFVKGMFKPHRE